MDSTTGISGSPQHLRELLQDKESGIITQEQLEIGCHYWTYDHAIQELAYKPYPSEPLDITRWLALSSRERENASEDVKSRMALMCRKFYEHKYSIVHENRRNYDYLGEMVKTFKRYGNTERIKKVNDILAGYEGKEKSF